MTVGTRRPLDSTANPGGRVPSPYASTIGVIMDQTRTPETETHSQLLTITEAAARLRTPVATLRYWRHLGTGPDSFRLGRRVVYRRDDIDRWITAQHDSQAIRPR
jgi:predicted DNA-binding transcriptional regulator AlpA